MTIISNDYSKLEIFKGYYCDKGLNTTQHFSLTLSGMIFSGEKTRQERR